MRAMDETKPSGAASEAKPEGDNSPINIKIKDSQGEVHFRVKMNTKFNKVIRSHAFAHPSQ